MKFVDDGDTAAPALAEWLARVSPFLPADDPHQACLRRARHQGLGHVNSVCDCPKRLPCQDGCCNPSSEEW